MSANLIQVSDELVSIFTGMASVLSQSSGAWPTSMLLPFPTGPPGKSSEISKDSEHKRRSKLITACPHVQRKHYAKNMCNNCYHKSGRNKNAWECEHQDRKHYAKGYCQMCYLKFYNLNKVNKNRG
jgi:hypothetical protein